MKGVSGSIDLDLRPLNFFIGPNSSGESSCLHGLAALSQTVKISNSASPLVLDDDFAYIHLGRFIEVIHSKTYSDAICLGITVNDFPIWRFRKNQRIEERSEGSAIYSFKCIMRTQEMYFAEACLRVKDRVYEIKKSKDVYILTSKASGASAPVDLRTGFVFQDFRMYMQDPEAEQWKDDDFHALNYLQRAVQFELGKVAYLGPFRQPPSRRYQTRGSSPREVGAAGEATMTLLSNEAVQSRTRKHIAQIQGWLKHLGLGNRIDVNRVAASDMFGSRSD